MDAHSFELINQDAQQHHSVAKGHNDEEQHPVTKSEKSIKASKILTILTHNTRLDLASMDLLLYVCLTNARWLFHLRLPIESKLTGSDASHT